MSLAAYIQKIMRFCAKHRNLLLSVCGTLCAVALFFYLRAFFATGVDMDGAFLIKQKSGGTVVYTGSNAYGSLCVSVSQSNHGADVVYTVAHNKAHTYTVVFQPDSEFWQTVSITDGWTGEILFNGKYQKGNRFLYDEYDRPVYGDVEQTDGENPYINFSPNLRRMVGFAAGEYEHIAGAWLRLVLGGVLNMLVFLHVRYPLLTMRMERRILGREPLPSEARLLFHTALHLVILFAAALLLTSAV